eukprot:3629779-Amphidinium_carterae.3
MGSSSRPRRHRQESSVRSQPSPQRQKPPSSERSTLTSSVTATTSPSSSTTTNFRPPLTSPSQFHSMSGTSAHPQSPVYVKHEEAHLVNQDIIAILFQDKEAAPLLSLINTALAVKLEQFQPNHHNQHREDELQSNPRDPERMLQLQGGAHSHSSEATLHSPGLEGLEHLYQAHMMT